MLSLDQIFRSYLQIKGHYKELETELGVFRAQGVKTFELRELFLQKIKSLSVTLKLIYPVEDQFNTLKATDVVLKNPIVLDSHPVKTLARNIDAQILMHGRARIDALLQTCYHEALPRIEPIAERFESLGFNPKMVELLATRLPKIKMLDAPSLKLILQIIAEINDKFLAIDDSVPEFNFIGKYVDCYSVEERALILSHHAKVQAVYNEIFARKLDAIRLFFQMTRCLLQPKDLIKRLGDEPMLIGDLIGVGMKAHLDGKFSVVTGDEIGKGSFGTIINTDFCGKRIVIKKVSGAEDAHDLLRGSFLAMNWLHTKTCVKVLSIEHETTAMAKAELNLFEIARDNKKFLAINSLEFFKDMVLALGVLHSHHLTHGDLSLANFLLETDEDELGLDRRNYRMSLADYDSLDFEGNKRLQGTYLYTAPEMALDPARFEFPTKQTNCWSLGVIFYEMLCQEDNLIDVPDDQKQNMDLIFSTITALTQPEIDAKIEALEREDHFGLISDYAFTEKLKLLGKRQAQAILIEMGHARLKEKEVQEELAAKAIAPDLSNRVFRQFLLDLGVKKFISENPFNALKKLFVEEGFKVYQAMHPDKAHLEAEVRAIAHAMFSKIKAILSKLLQIDPAKRASMDEIYATFFDFSSVVDEEKPSEKSFSLLELDD